MARTKTSPDTAPSAAHAATDPAPAPGTAPAADSPAAAVHAALAANPGGTVAVIADATGTGKPATRAALLEMEADGIATRVKGTKPGIPDTWTLADLPPDAAGPAAGPEAGQVGQPGDDPAGSPDGATEDETAGDPAPEDGDDAEAGALAAPAPETAESESHDAPVEDDHEDAVPDEQDAEDEPADAGGESGDEPDPALVTDLTGHLDQIRAAADEAELDLTMSGDLKTVLAGLDEIGEQAAQARRALKAAIGGRKAPAVRPGGLRDKVLAHLVAHPDKEFTPHEIHKVLGHSSGAIANALDTLVKLGEAEVDTEKPRRFRRAAQPAGAAPDADGAPDAEQQETDLAGAA